MILYFFSMQMFILSIWTWLDGLLRVRWRWICKCFRASIRKLFEWHDSNPISLQYLFNVQPTELYWRGLLIQLWEYDCHCHLIRPPILFWLLRKLSSVYTNVETNFFPISSLCDFAKLLCKYALWPVYAHLCVCLSMW